MAGSHAASWLFTEQKGPRAVVRTCLLCSHYELVRTGIVGVGRGYGMREGNKARGRMIQHINEAHPQEVVQIARLSWPEKQKVEAARSSAGRVLAQIIATKEG